LREGPAACSESLDGLGEGDDEKESKLRGEGMSSEDGLMNVVAIEWVGGELKLRGGRVRGILK
jgi:hypothetical protein